MGWDRVPKVPAAEADVRLGAQSRLTSDIAQAPKSAVGSTGQRNTLIFSKDGVWTMTPESEPV